MVQLAGELHDLVEFPASPLFPGIVGVGHLGHHGLGESPPVVLVAPRLLAEIAQEFPEVSFAWGTAADTFGLDNVYSYEAASDEGGYVMGKMAAALTTSNTIGVVGPVEVGDANLFVDGFKNGAEADAVAVRERLDALYDTYAYDITPVSDDAPFFWHFARFRDATTTSMTYSRGGAVAFQSR